MASRWLHRAVVVTAVAATVTAFMSAAGWSNTAISINSGNVPTTAAEFENQLCDPNQGGGPYAGQDVWVFVLPGNHATTGDFVSLELYFDTNGDGTADTTKLIPGDGGTILGGGPSTSKAYIALPAG